MSGYLKNEFQIALVQYIGTYIMPKWKKFINACIYSGYRNKRNLNLLKKTDLSISEHNYCHLTIIILICYRIETFRCHCDKIVALCKNYFIGMIIIIFPYHES